MEEIIFIPGKGIGTKDIKTNTITMHFQVPADFNHRLYINKPLVISVPIEGGDPIDLMAYLSDTGNNYFYSSSHGTYVIKLDIILQDTLLMGYLLKADSFSIRRSSPTKND